MENWTYFEIFINYLKIKHIFQVPIHSITKCNLITAFPKITPQIMQTPLPHMISSNHGPVRHLPLEMMSHWKFKEKVFKKKKKQNSLKNNFSKFLLHWFLYFWRIWNCGKTLAVCKRFLKFDSIREQDEKKRTSLTQ